MALKGAPFRSTGVILLLLAITFPAIAYGSATQKDGTLNIVLDFIPPIPGGPEPLDQSATIVVNSGNVTIFGVPGTGPDNLFLDGVTFHDVDTIVVDSGAGNDNVNFEVVTGKELGELSIEVNSRAGQAETKINIIVPEAPVRVPPDQEPPGKGLFIGTIDLHFGNLEDKLQLEMESLVDTKLFVRADGPSGENSIGIKAMYASGTTVFNDFMFVPTLGGFEDEIIIDIKSEAHSLTNVFSIDSGPGEDITKIMIEQLGTGVSNNILNLSHGNGEDSTDVSIRSPNAAVGLSGSINVSGAAFGDDDKVNIEVDAPEVLGELVVTSGAGADQLNAFLKGSLGPGTLTLSAGTGDDKLKVLVEGGLGMTVPPSGVTLDGGAGFDECEAFPGATFTDACEIQKR